MGNPRGAPVKLDAEKQRLISKIYYRLTKEGKPWTHKGIYADSVSAWRKQGIPDREIPGYDSIRNYINEKLLPYDKPLDKPWFVSMMKEYPIPPETLPIILIGKYEFERKSGHKLTIREALWVIRLISLYDPNKKKKSISKIFEFAEEYAAIEQFNETGSGRDEGFEAVTDSDLAQEFRKKELTTEEIRNLFEDFENENGKT